MSKAGDTAMDQDESSGGLSPAAMSVFVSSDMLGLWRLRMSLALDDARWYHRSGRKIEATQMVAAARSCNRQIVRILHFLHTGIRAPQSMDFAVRFRLDDTGTPPRSDEISRPGPKPGLPAAAVVARTPAQLSTRESQIVGLMAGGLSNAEIAAKLSISTGCLSTHASNMRRKLGMASVSQVRQWAQRRASGASA